MQIKRAERKNVKIKLAITGIPGTGKTMGALLMASGLSDTGKILVIDTENSSASLFSDHPLMQDVVYDTLDLTAPYTVDKYLKALELGVQGGYDVIIMDSISHQWDGEGGALDKKHALDMKGGNSFTNWGGIKKEAKIFQQKLLSAPVHIIATMRSKIAYAVETNEKNKSAPVKVGMEPIQIDGIEYEFTTVFDMSRDKTYSVSKDRTARFDGRMERISKNTGEEIKRWLKEGRTVAPEEIKQLSMVDSLVGDLNMCFASGDSDKVIGVYSAIEQELKPAVWSKMSADFKSWFRSVMEK